MMDNSAMPAFSAYQSTAQTIGATTWTKVNFETEEFDTASCFASHRFTPNVAGYYQVNAAIESGSNLSYMLMSIYKNGTQFKRFSCGATVGSGVSGSALIYLNGSTDYLEVYAYLSSGVNLTNYVSATFFQATLVKNA